ncbi:MAG: PLP-dependent aspartate aminotransferase family protein [Gammaproteobacteria bacterium]|nr:PLP-dependent aspartate aminotransferase family protein [Gammaproteobacteria bacterium]
MKKSTQAVRAGSRHDINMGGLNTPLLPSSAIEYMDDSEVRYPRYFNTLNHDVVADKMSALEHAEAGLVTSSGMAAISAILFGLLGSGDHVVFTEGLYGGTHALIVNELQRFGISHSFATTDVRELEAACRPETRMIYVESPSNPLMTVVDLPALAAFARHREIITVIDNTFASPILQNPLLHGFDLVMHSGTKYLGGHSDLICGTVNGSAAMVASARNHAVAYGGCLNAQDCYLLERSLKTLELRVQRQSDNAGLVAALLDADERVKKVHYPGLEDHPGHAIAARQMHGFGGMLSFELADDIDPIGYIRRLELVNCAISLGGVETTICQPVATSHQKVSEEERQRLGITDGLLRLSVGIEDSEDISADLLQALG